MIGSQGQGAIRTVTTERFEPTGMCDVATNPTISYPFVSRRSVNVHQNWNHERAGVEVNQSVMSGGSESCPSEVPGTHRPHVLLQMIRVAMWLVEYLRTRTFVLVLGTAGLQGLGEPCPERKQATVGDFQIIGHIFGYAC